MTEVAVCRMDTTSSTGMAGIFMTSSTISGSVELHAQMKMYFVVAQLLQASFHGNNLPVFAASLMLMYRMEP